MRKLIALLAAIILIVSSIGFAAAQSDGFTWNPDGEVDNKTAEETYQRIHSQDGGDPDPSTKEGEYVLGVDISGDYLLWSAYTHSASGANDYWIDAYARDLSEGENLDQNPGHIATLGVEEIDPAPAQSIVSGNGIREYGPNKNIVFSSIYGNSQMIDDDSAGDTTTTGEVYTTWEKEGTSYEVVHNNQDSNLIHGTAAFEINGSERIVSSTDSGTYSYNRETGNSTQLFAHSLYKSYIQGDKISNESIMMYNTNTTTQYTAVERYGMNMYYNYSSGNWSYIYANTLAVSDSHIAINHQDGTTPEKWGNQTLIFNKTGYEEMLDGSSSEYEYTDEALEKAVHTVPFPDNVTGFEDGFYAGNHWFFTDAESNKIYVYNDELSDLEAVINEPWEEWLGFQTGFTGTVANGNVSYATFDNNEMTVYDSQIQVETTPSGCMAYLQPSDLTQLSEAPNVCWIPMFTGIWILATPFQWLLLAVLIAMPIAKMTQSDIATMATIDGVLLIGMILGTLSPGFVAIGILTTVLLAAYGRSGANITINNGGNGGI